MKYVRRLVAYFRALEQLYFVEQVPPYAFEEPPKHIAHRLGRHHRRALSELEQFFLHFLAIAFVHHVLPAQPLDEAGPPMSAEDGREQVAFLHGVGIAQYRTYLPRQVEAE